MQPLLLLASALIGSALAASPSSAPPSSTLSGPAGQLTWTVSPAADGLHITGHSPKWTVTHQPCAEVELQRTGLLRLVGPTWRYWYADDGHLLHFEGPAETFSAAGTSPVGGAK